MTPQHPSPTPSQPSSIRHDGVPVRQACFNSEERRILLNTPKIGPQVVKRLEEVGFASFDNISAVGVHAVVESVCQLVGQQGWANRRRALAAALQVSLAGQATRELK